MHHRWGGGAHGLTLFIHARHKNFFTARRLDLDLVCLEAGRHQVVELYIKKHAIFFFFGHAFVLLQLVS